MAPVALEKEVQKFIEGKRREYCAETDFGLTCLICMEDFGPSAEDSTRNLVQLNCAAKHVFHAKCISIWLNTKQSCPYCRECIHIKPGGSV